MKFETKSLEGGIGAEVIGLDLDAPIDEETARALNDVWLDAAIVLFRETGTSNEQHLRLSRCFGELEVHPVESIRLEENDEIIVLDGINRGVNAEGKPIDNYELALFGGYEMIVNRTNLILHLAYKVLYKDVEGRLPVFYQRLGVKQFVYGNWFAGMNVRFHELGSADNLEWNVGCAVGL